ncbi:hypothetical protein GCM10027160_28540 [Streptomyces calidiresistens]
MRTDHPTPPGGAAPGPLDTRALDRAVERLADRLRRLPESRLRQGAAGEGLRLARRLAGLTRRIEGVGPDPAELPAIGVFAVGDQLAVTGHDLSAALGALGDVPEAREAMAEALGLLRACEGL